MQTVLALALIINSMAATQHSVVVTKLVVNSDPIVPNMWHFISWREAEIEDIKSWDAAIPTLIDIPTRATRGRCGFQISISVPLPHTGNWSARMSTTNSGERDLPYEIRELEGIGGVRRIAAFGPWFLIGAGERIDSSQFIRAGVWVPNEGSYVDSNSWVQCEFVVDMLSRLTDS